MGFPERHDVGVGPDLTKGYQLKVNSLAQGALQGIVVCRAEEGTVGLSVAPVMAHHRRWEQR